MHDMKTYLLGGVERVPYCGLRGSESQLHSCIMSVAIRFPDLSTRAILRGRIFRAVGLSPVFVLPPPPLESGDGVVTA
jgi:hypothetical protein